MEAGRQGIKLRSVKSLFIQIILRYNYDISYDVTLYIRLCRENIKKVWKSLGKYMAADCPSLHLNSLWLYIEDQRRFTEEGVGGNEVYNRYYYIYCISYKKYILNPYWIIYLLETTIAV